VICDVSVDFGGGGLHSPKVLDGMLTPLVALGTIQDVASFSHISPIGPHTKFGFFDAAKHYCCSVVGHLNILKLSTLCQFLFSSRPNDASTQSSIHII
jgi:hypothetical protein